MGPQAAHPAVAEAMCVRVGCMCSERKQGGLWCLQETYLTPLVRGAEALLPLSHNAVPSFRNQALAATVGGGRGAAAAHMENMGGAGRSTWEPLDGKL